MIPSLRQVATALPACRKRLLGKQWHRMTRNQSSFSNTAPTVVEKAILDSIKAMGPLPFATYMQQCLSHPTHGYYMNPSNPVFGARGDFITSPEISQVFGELIAIWFLSQWVAAGQPSSIRLVELGPGRGTLMADILRVISKIPSAKAVQRKSVQLVETSPAMRRAQENTLQKFADEHGWELQWNNSIEDIPPETDDYTILVAHEFFDALPIHIVEKTQKGWQELLVASASDGKSSIATSPRLKAVLSPEPSPVSSLLGMSSQRFSKLPIGTRIEVSPSSFKISRRIGELIAGSSAGGSALVIDYGEDKVFNNSFRAFKDHKIVDIFHRPGECDLTSNVDFAYLKESFSDIAVPHGPMSQANFLKGMGIDMRVDALVKAASTEERQKVIRDAALRLADPVGMGKEYQVLGITSKPTSEDGSPGVWPFVASPP
ncbi:hypothetical protein PC9H_009825 [Pleurotus ostreatus]|uniref:Protein arginine methyltransferase NDUFAF7 n=1 Tax=Pleurotus ostreatus TaxID=5322 RepID=A0A8H6ZMI8_PLEOS|nr:uncharacterized protein PC9H_009825 [Pleurotus ostreatus]KAF7424518.1 hypothetical protein PC9H_009825 [Pleurotus ostreatus]KAJ8692531.1 hypothetical protein PTI98_009835 [Pleurotus ostreatus]